MIKIGKTYVRHADDQIRLCADVSVNERCTTLWFGVEPKYESGLSVNCSDPFVMLLLPMAMRRCFPIQCASPMSERLHYQLTNQLIPVLAAAGPRYHQISIQAPLTTQKILSLHAVGTGFSGGVDSLYSVMRHTDKSLYPLTHLAVFNSGVFEGELFREQFRRCCLQAAAFAQEQGLQTVFVDSNMSTALPERFLDVYSFRNLACALALQGLFSVYLLSSGIEFAGFSLDLFDSASYDLLTVSCASTESLNIYLSGGETTRVGKIKALSQWPPSYRWLHPCPSGRPGDVNCGHCKKCIRTMTALYALGCLERYEHVFNIDDYYRHLDQNIGFVLANRGISWFDETIALMDEHGIVISPAAHIYEQQFLRAIRNLKQSQKEKTDADTI